MRRARWAPLIALIVSGLAAAAGGIDRVARQPATAPGETRAQQDRAIAAVTLRPNVYAATIAPYFRRKTSGIAARVYVPNTNDGTVDVIDPQIREVVARFSAGLVPHHITPAWDFSALYVANTSANTLTVIDPSTALPADTLRIVDPYNLYFTPDGTAAIVVAERLWRLDFYDRRTWAPLGSVPISHAGVDHLDFSADGTYLLASAEFSGMVVKVDLAHRAEVGAVSVGGFPVDVRLAPDGAVFFVANQARHGVSVIDPERMEEVAFIPTGRGAHGLQVSRDAQSLYVSNRLAGTVSVIDFATRQVSATWQVGGSPDMMQLSPDGGELWVSNRYARSVSVIDTATGQLLTRITVGSGPHGLSYFPQPGLISLGHNGVYR